MHRLHVNARPPVARKSASSKSASMNIRLLSYHADNPSFRPIFASSLSPKQKRVLFALEAVRHSFQIVAYYNGYKMRIQVTKA